MALQQARTTPTGPEDWPIAAAMIQYPGTLPDGTSVQDQSAEEWALALGDVADAGFDCVDPTESWLRIGDLSPERLREFQDVVADLGLRVPAVSSARRSPVDPEHGEEHMATLHRGIDAAAAVGAEVFNVGFFRALLPAQQRALWFWTAQGPVDAGPDEDPETYRLAVDRVRELGRHAAENGLVLSLEMYEDTYVGTADGAVRLVTDVDLPEVGLNPDLGNLQRLHRPVERWTEMAAKVLPHTNFWHAKNYLRTEDETTGAISTAPAPLETGVMSYRQMLADAVALGFRGPITCEHYGGDGLSVSARNRDYLRGLLGTRRIRGMLAGG
ncbi:sugar phosphate isomerase/epimerase family protein [Pseudokineococcus sp. 5B2Z-1]|uniref:sugar phosphate isomerase/epimerase family protein n=2 Tax=Pseudokineococcus sp. 5B2Z-1 TaxID=3132744 RepID=UPI0030B4F95C